MACDIAGDRPETVLVERGLRHRQVINHQDGQPDAKDHFPAMLLRPPGQQPLQENPAIQHGK